MIVESGYQAHSAVFGETLLIGFILELNIEFILNLSLSMNHSSSEGRCMSVSMSEPEKNDWRHWCRKVCKVKVGESGGSLPEDLCTAAGLTRRGQQQQFGEHHKNSFAPSVALTSPHPSALHLTVHLSDMSGMFKLEITHN